MMITHTRKAQASFEYLGVFALGLIVLIPLIFLVQQYSTKSSTDIQSRQLNQIGSDMVTTAESVYYMGPPARLTIRETFPVSVTNVSFQTDWSEHLSVILFNSGQVTTPFFTAINLNTSLPPNMELAGLKTITFNAMNSSQGNYVNIIFS